MTDAIHNPAHYTVYPVQPIEITRHLGFCLGNAVKYVLRAPYKGGVEDCLKAMRYLELELGSPQMPLYSEPEFFAIDAINTLAHWLRNTDGDTLWQDIASYQSNFLDNVREYLVDIPKYRMVDFDFGSLREMSDAVRELRRVLELRDTTGQIYEGMTGLPQKQEAEE